jgi:predicted RNA-binding Zn ribbon-like protein
MTEFEYSGGALCLDFANTWEDRSDPASDHLHDYLDLLEWAFGAGVVVAGERSDFEGQARRESEAADRVFRTAIRIREHIYQLCSSVASGDGPVEADVTALNTALQGAPKKRLCRRGECCELEWPAEEVDLRRPLWPVVLSAAELVTSPEIKRVRECAAPDCSWLFVDSSRGGRRRWCDMNTCGNRAKARRYYERHMRNT